LTVSSIEPVMTLSSVGHVAAHILSSWDAAFFEVVYLIVSGNTTNAKRSQSIL
jgi:tRNA A37 threonylcarbamoyltransferase TsaD